MHGALNLDNLARIENKLLEDFDFSNFYELGQGNFLDFLLRCDEVKRV